MSKTYEYRTEEMDNFSSEGMFTKDIYVDTDALNEMSGQGWELVCTTPTQLIFKKEVN